MTAKTKPRANQISDFSYDENDDIVTTKKIACNSVAVDVPVSVPNGGTGLSTLAAGRIPYGAGTGDFGNSENLFWDSVNNRMGINTNSPLQSFHNVGESTVLERTGSASGHLVRFYRSGTQKWILQTGATVDQDDMRLLNSAVENVFSILQNKNIGINTTAPTKKLEVKDDSGAQLRLTDSTGNYTDFQTDGDGNLTIAPSGKHTTIHGYTETAIINNTDWFLEGLRADVGATWTKIEMGAALEYIRSLCYLGNGIALAGAGSGTGDGDIYKSSDYGDTWTKIEMGAALEDIRSLCYLGNGIVLAGAGNSTGDGDIYKSIDYGDTWTKIEMGAALEYIISLCYLGNGIVLAGAGNSTGDGDIYKSSDYGDTWTKIEMGADLEYILSLCYLGNGIVLAGAGISTGDGDIYKSSDYGDTWTKIEMGAALEYIISLCYLGNGIVLAGAGYSTGDGDIYKSIDYGDTWTKTEMGADLEGILSLCYLGNGIVLAGAGTSTGDGDIYKSSVTMQESISPTATVEATAGATTGTYLRIQIDGTWYKMTLLADS